MILGVGIDSVEVSRIQAALKRQGQRFIARIGLPCELRNAPQKTPRQAQYWAARFAAKEAFAKALGTGIGQSVQWRSVGIKKSPLGAPKLEVSKTLASQLKKRGIVRSHVAITHTHGLATAVVILEGQDS